jgi:PleD family two-component response regulator
MQAIHCACPMARLVGSFCLLDRSPRAFSSAEVDILKDFALIVENEFAVMSAATTDELTGLFNRRAFDNLVKFAISSARRRAEPLALAWLGSRWFQTDQRHLGPQRGR